MKRTPITLQPKQFPEEFHPLISGADVYDSSCSREARVYFIDKQDGFYLKCAPAGTLEKEAAVTGFFHQKGLGAEVLAYQ